MAPRSVISTTDKKVAFYAPEALYKGIASTLGLKISKDAKGLDATPSDGAKGKLVRIRLNFEGGRSATCFCDPAKASGVRKGLPGKTAKGKKIKSVTFVNG
jgi:hypothetical protein